MIFLNIKSKLKIIIKMKNISLTNYHRSLTLNNQPLASLSFTLTYISVTLIHQSLINANK